MSKRYSLICALALAAAAATLALGGGTARADTSSVVSFNRCAFGSGSTTVPAGDVMLHIGGYAVGTKGLMTVVQAAQTTTLQVGDSTYDLSNLWSSPVYNPLGFWVIRQPDFDLGTLASGQTVTVTFDMTFSHPVTILYPPVGPSGDNGPYTITEDGPYTCTLTAS